MTYVVGVKRFGTTAIITDSRLSNAEPNVSVIKSGILFPGCIYGVTGNWERACDCIDRIRSRCTQSTLAERFHEFTKFIYYYNFPLGDLNAFDILLSSRHEGVPDFYYISSDSGHVHPTNGDLWTLGSGKAQLDEILVPFAETLMSESGLQTQRERMAEGGLPSSKEDFAHMFCFLLFQRTYGDAGRRLAGIDVGGFVHFVLQDAEGERRQSPRLYVLVEKGEDGGLGLLRERLAFDRDDELGEIIVVAQAHAALEPSWMIAMQNTSNATVTVADFQARFAPVRDRHKTEPLYHVMVAGAVDFEKRKPQADNYKIAIDIWHGTPAIGLDGECATIEFFEFVRDHI